jgi:hypothetical protein
MSVLWAEAWQAGTIYLENFTWPETMQKMYCPVCWLVNIAETTAFPSTQRLREEISFAAFYFKLTEE